MALRKEAFAFLISLVSQWALPAAVHGDEAADREVRLKFFETEVRPILANHCYNCHSADNKASGGLRVDDHRGLLEGGGRGPAIVPNEPDRSLLLTAVSHSDEKLKMPPDHRLSDEEIGTLRKWIQEGAVWPEIVVPEQLLTHDASYEELKRTHWAWQPLTQPTVPTVAGAWPRSDIDRFVLARLDASGLKPVEDASKVSLIRRLSFDLTGLPPTKDEVFDFLLDESPESVENLVDRLLASPAFGERWGRHWLDVARYGESTGASRNLPYPHAWRYRDYVIRALNEDKPYDQFIKEQIAGDLLPANSPAEKAEQLVATGFLALGVKDVNQRFQVRYDMDNVDEQIDVVTRSVLGLTASCARCHNHKFDPIPTAEYYGLAGIFKSTELRDALRNQMGGSGFAYYVPNRLLLLNETKATDNTLPERIAQARAAAEAARAEVLAFRDSVKQPNDPDREERFKKLRKVAEEKHAELIALTDPAKQGPVAIGVVESNRVGDTEIRLRGEAEALGPVAPRGFLSLIPVVDAPKIPKDQSGRLELARWLTDETNPLTSRVLVNRVWAHLFTRGIVQSVDNFGVTGDTPSHPELLDHLANHLIQEKWSIKRLIRYIVLSRTYQLSAASTPEHLAQDPANRLLWRHHPRRLDAEELRDAVLATTGQLDREPPKEFSSAELPVREVDNNGPEAEKLLAVAAKSKHRSLYLPLLRGIVPAELAPFDFVEQSMVTGRRDITTTAHQALFLLNSDFMHAQSATWAEQILGNAIDPKTKVTEAYRAILGRQPTSAEVESSLKYLREYGQEATKLTQQAAASTADPSEKPSEQKPDPNVPPVSTVAASTSTSISPASDSNPPSETGKAAEPNAKVLSPENAAWASFLRTLYASAEFRYLK